MTTLKGFPASFHTLLHTLLQNHSTRRPQQINTWYTSQRVNTSTGTLPNTARSPPITPYIISSSKPTNHSIHRQQLKAHQSIHTLSANLISKSVQLHVIQRLRDTAREGLSTSWAWRRVCWAYTTLCPCRPRWGRRSLGKPCTSPDHRRPAAACRGT